MPIRALCLFVAALTLAAATAIPATAAATRAANNIAPEATLRASINERKLPRLVDGEVAPPGSRTEHSEGWPAGNSELPASVTFEWDEPRTIAAVVHYAWTAWGMRCFSDYEVVIDGADEPIVAGSFAAAHGPQIVELPPGTQARTLTLRFLGRHNKLSSVAEVQVFSEPPSQEDLLAEYVDFAFDLRLGYYPSHNLLRLFAPDPPADATAWHAAVRPRHEARVLAERGGELPMSPAGEGLKLPELEPGFYTLTLTLTGGEEPLVVERSFQRRRFEWEGNELGLDDVIVPPFTPLKADADRGTVDSVLRTHRHGAAGMWEQVTSRGRDLLAGPVRLEATIDGERRVAGGEAPRFTESRDSRVAGRAAWSAGPLSGVTRFDYDYDGFMQLELALDRTDAEVQSLQLVIPMKATYAWLIHPVTSGLRHHYAGRLPEGEGEVWDTSGVNRLIDGHFVPYLYLGGPERGVCFAADNDRDWVRGEGVPMMSIDRDGETVNLRLNLIAAPRRLERERTLRFALQATPAKPMPSEPYSWRRWWNTRTAPTHDDVQVLFWGANQYWGGRHFATSVYPDDKRFSHWEKLAEQRRTGEVDRAYFDRWIARYDDLPPNQKAKVVPAMRAGLQWSSYHPPNTADTTKFRYIVPYTNPRGASAEDTDFQTTYLDEWQTIDITHPRWHHIKPFNRVRRMKGYTTWYHVEPVPSRVDMLLHYHRKMVETFADGIYWDNMFLRASRVPPEAGGPAYRDDDGKLRAGVNLTDFRSLVRRTAVMMHLTGKRPLTFHHMTNTNIVPVLSFGTLNLDWEWRDLGPWASRDLQDRLRADKRHRADPRPEPRAQERQHLRRHQPLPKTLRRHHLRLALPHRPGRVHPPRDQDPGGIQGRLLRAAEAQRVRLRIPRLPRLPLLGRRLPPPHPRRQQPRPGPPQRR